MGQGVVTGKDGDDKKQGSTARERKEKPEVVEGGPSDSLRHASDNADDDSLDFVYFYVHERHQLIL